MAKSTNRQMAINMASSVAVFALNLCISFFLTPFIIDKLGTAAYGFVGLSGNIIGYASLLTVAVNSMSGRFITISTHKQDYEQANCYISSIFYTNLGLAAFILTAFCVVTYFLPDLINIPTDLIKDVQTLFILLGISSCLGLMTGVIAVATFIRNRLDITNTRNLIGTIIRVTIMLCLFGFLVPKLWYIGIAALIMNIYTICVNYHFFKVLTPELKIKRIFFNISHIKEVVSAGVWGIITKLSDMLNRGFDLLLANLFISAWAMGLLSITLVIPGLIWGFFATIAGNFAPIFTKLYAINDFDGLKNELLKSVRLCGFFCCIPISFVFAYIDIFYSKWLPSEDYHLLYIITILGAAGLICAMPLEPLWNIFTITNKVKRSSLNLLANGACVIGIVLIGMYVTENHLYRLIILASTRTIINTFRSVTFLPLYGCKCLGFPIYTFYPILLKNILNIVLITGLSLIFKHLFLQFNIISLIAGGIFTFIIGIMLSSIIVLKKTDRQFILAKLNHKFHLNLKWI